MLSWLNAFFSGELDQLITHIVLLGGSIAAEFAVAIGIVLETPKEKTCRERIGMVLVLGGVSVGAVLTISLFVFDEGISRQQTSKIIALETRLAPRILTTEQIGRIAERLKAFSATPFDISLNTAPEPIALSAKITEALIKAGWQKVPTASGGGIKYGNGETIIPGFVGISIEVSHKKFEQWGPALVALGSALQAEGLKVDKILNATDDVTPDNAIHLYIGAKE